MGIGWAPWKGGGVYFPPFQCIPWGRGMGWREPLLCGLRTNPPCSSFGSQARHYMGVPRSHTWYVRSIKSGTRTTTPFHAERSSAQPACCACILHVVFSGNERNRVATCHNCVFLLCFP